jgi:hypothetical protein
MQYLTKPIFRVLRPVPLAFFSQKKDLKLKDIDERCIECHSRRNHVLFIAGHHNPAPQVGQAGQKIRRKGLIAARDLR